KDDLVDALGSAGFKIPSPGVLLAMLNLTKLHAKYGGFLIGRPQPIVQLLDINTKMYVYMYVLWVCPKNPHLRTACLNILLSLTEILCKSSEELSNGDLADACSALRYVTKAGLKLDWLVKKLKEAGETRMQGIEEELKDLKNKCSDMNTLLEFLR
ncbi:unnamed protein product, partial [Thlaspi arvense]